MCRCCAYTLSQRRSSNMFGHSTCWGLLPWYLSREYDNAQFRRVQAERERERERERQHFYYYFNNNRKTTNNPCTSYVAKYIQGCNKGSASAIAASATTTASATASTATAATAAICCYYCTATTTPSHQTVIIIIIIPSIPIVPIRSLPPACYFIFGMTGLIELFPQLVFWLRRLEIGHNNLMFWFFRNM